uniref:Uncharacterized protein n=1 Tax=Xiphophorus maculatus TaxID=8083 RepID=A0A3B5PXZ4_XIPMA
MKIQFKLQKRKTKKQQLYFSNTFLELLSSSGFIWFRYSRCWLKLLRWFANTVSIDNRGNVRLTFEPESDYGSHHYGNFEGMLNPPPWGYKYYTVGNIPTSASLPSYVVNSQRNTVGNSARILLRVNEGRQIDQVFITQHYDEYENQGSSYDPEQTFRITTNFLRQLRNGNGTCHIILRNMQLWCLLIVIMTTPFSKEFL